jgi:hypothetical protein
VSRRPLVFAVVLAATLAAPAGAQAALTAVAAATPDRGGAPLHVSFDGTGSAPDPGRTIVSWDWDFGDGASGSGVTVAHNYGAAGLYTVTLTVTDDHDATSSAQVQVRAQALGLSLSRHTVVFGNAVRATGTLTPAQAGVTVALEQRSGGAWASLASTSTDGSGHFAASFAPSGGGAVRARVNGGAVSAAKTLAVVPRLTLHRGTARAFLGAPLRVAVRPLAYSGRIVATTLRAGRVVGRVTRRVRDGRLRITAPTPGIGRFTVRLRFPASGRLAARTVSVRVRARARTLAVGSHGPDVRALIRRLVELHYRVPGISSTFSWSTHDAVLAFQKTKWLSRTGVVGPATWRALGRARIPRARYAKPLLHIEVDKARQILMVVRDGKVSAVLPVSTGATGNTPLGAWRIYLKTPGYNALGMYYSMYWLRGFAVHGYASVPAYPASHGCVRIPIWSARWLYDRSSVGERVFVYV